MTVLGLWFVAKYYELSFVFINLSRVLFHPITSLSNAVF